MQIIINLTPEEKQALEFDEPDFHFLFESQLIGIIRAAQDKIVNLTIQEAFKQGIQLPATKEEVIALGFQKKWAMPKKDYLAKLAAEQATKP